MLKYFLFLTLICGCVESQIKHEASQNTLKDSATTRSLQSLCLTLASPEPKLEYFLNDGDTTRCFTDYPSDGCSWVGTLPSATLGYSPTPICKQHDICYRAIGRNRADCDKTFKALLDDACKDRWCKKVIGGAKTCDIYPVDIAGLQTCKLTSQGMYEAVRNLSSATYDGRQKDTVSTLKWCGRAGRRQLPNPYDLNIMDPGIRADQIERIIAASNFDRSKLNRAYLDTPSFKLLDYRERIAAYLSVCVDPEAKSVQYLAANECEPGYVFANFKCQKVICKDQFYAGQEIRKYDIQNGVVTEVCRSTGAIDTLVACNRGYKRDIYCDAACISVSAPPSESPCAP